MENCNEFYYVFVFLRYQMTRKSLVSTEKNIDQDTYKNPLK